MENQIITLTEELASAWNDHDVDRIVSFYAPDYEGVDVNTTNRQTGLQAIHSYISLYFTAFPDLRFETEEILIQGNKVAIAWKAQGTHRGVLMNIPPTHRAVTVQGISVMTIIDGKIQQARNVWDMAGLLRDIHLLPEL
jgi:steroid delta-isomerase-like uncharacterized protein